MEKKQQQQSSLPDISATRAPELTMLNGAPAPIELAQTAGERGPILLQDIHYVEKQAAFNRERIPERVVHGKGAGAYGTFKVTGDITKYTVADLFSSVGKETPVFVRFSRAVGRSGSNDTARDVRGFAIKFYTKQGNYDMVGNNHPVFFVRDPFKFPDVIHSLQRDPRNDTEGPIPMWDFFSLTPESLHHVTMFFSDRGTPMSYRNMHGFSANTYSFINAKGEVFYFKMHLLTLQGIKNLDKDQAGMLAGQDPDFLSRDLYESILEGNHPRWRLCVQVMPAEAAWKYPAAFDVTKVWPHKQYPLVEVGILELNRNPTDAFAEVEQAAFSPSNVVPGISLSPDRVLQGRVFAYPDTQRYRLGVNYPHLHVNCPHFARISSYQRDGIMLPIVENKFPHYMPNSKSGPVESQKPIRTEAPMCIPDSATVGRYPTRPPIASIDDDTDFFLQPRLLFNLLPQDAKERLATNIATSLETVPNEIVDRQMRLFFQCDEQYGTMVMENLRARKQGKLSRTDAEWVKSAATQLLKTPEWKEDMLPQKKINDWPKKFKTFKLHSTPESESVPSAPHPSTPARTSTK